jgi:hypothetical protein
MATRTRPHFLEIGLAALLVVPGVLGQSNSGELNLSVTDPAGLGVKTPVELVSEVNQFRETLLTDGAGELAARNLPFGIYRIQVHHQGFAPFSSTVEVRSAIPTRYRVQLSLASTKTAVAVHNSDTLVDPHRTGTINRIGSSALDDRIASLPGRSVVNLVNSQPGWLYEGNAVLHPRGSEYQVQFVVDGIPLTDNRSPSFGPEIEADDVQSMSIFTANIPAEYGRKMGGVVEVITEKDERAGWHGKLATSGGSFSTAGGYAMTQYGWGRNTLAASADGGTTGRYLNPPVVENYTNRGTTSDFALRYERDLTDKDRLGVIVRREQSRFLVPNERIQQTAGQRQDRDSAETMGIISYQRIVSPNALWNLRLMVREDENNLWSNPLSTPIVAGQDRSFREQYVKANIAVHHGRQEWKAGVEADFTSLRERFNDVVTDPAQFDPGTPGTFGFSGRGRDFEQSAFVQDVIRLGKWTASAGLRWDHYQLLVNQNAVSPRLGVARYWPGADLVLHASYDRVFQTPAFENILLSSAPSIAALNPNFLRLPVLPSHGNYYEAGLTKGLFEKLKLDASYFRRRFNNYADDDLLLNTSISFPIAFRKADIYGAEGKIEIPAWGRWSGFVSYSYIVGSAYLPVTGGLFLGKEATLALSQTIGRFWGSQDQRHTIRTRFRYQVAPRLWVALGGNYGSGLPIEFEGTEQEAIAQYGPQIVDRVNLAHGRVKPAVSLDASIGADLRKSERFTLRLEGDVQNISDRLNVIDFAGLFSGNAVGPPRSANVRLTAEF